MKATFDLESFSFAGAAVHVAPTGDASLFQGDDVVARLRGLLAGHLLGVFPIAAPDDVHPDTWEMHPAGDETLLMLAGELDVEYADATRRGAAALERGRGVVLPPGVWHRLVLREPGLLLALTPPQETQFSRDPGSAS